MGNGEKSTIILVAGKEDLFHDLREALANTGLALLHARTKNEAIALLERLKSEIDLAIIELELPEFGGWDLIKQLTWRQQPVKIIAATSTYPEPFLEKIKELGVDQVVRAAILPEVWRQKIEAVLVKNESDS